MQTEVNFISFQGHSAEIISIGFNTKGDQVITGSFDHTVNVWDVNSGQLVEIHSLNKIYYWFIKLKTI